MINLGKNKMNFKPTLWKTLVSAIIGIIVFFYQSGYLKCDSPNGCTQVIFNFFIESLIIFAILYVIWSFFQKIKKK